MPKKWAFIFLIFLILHHLQNKIYGALVLKNIELADSLFSEKNKNIFSPGEQIYVHYTIQGLQESLNGTAWLDIDTSIFDETGNNINKNIATHTVKNKQIFKNEFTDYIVITIPANISDKVIFLNLVFKDQISHNRLEKGLELKISKSSLSVVNIRFTEDKNLTLEHSNMFLTKETVTVCFNVIGLKKIDNEIVLKYGFEVKNTSGNILHPLKKITNIKKSNDAIIAGKLSFTTGLPGNYTILIHTWDGFTDKKIITEKSFQVIDKQTLEKSVSINNSSLNNQEINIELFDQETFPLLYKKEKMNPENKNVKTDVTKKSLISQQGEFPDTKIKIYHESKGLYTFQYPNDWLVKDEEYNDKYIFFKEPFDEAMIIVYFTLTYQDSIEQIIEKRKQLQKELLPSFLEILPEEKIVLSGKNAVKFKYKGFDLNNQPSLGELTIIYDPNENYAFFVFLTCVKDRIDFFSKQYMSIIRSFKIMRSTKINKESMDNLIGTWVSADTEKNSQLEQIITFYNNGRFFQNKDDFFYNIDNISKFEDFIFNIQTKSTEDNDSINNIGKYKVVGDTLYLFYDNGNYSELALTLGEGAFIKLDQKYFNKRN